ncbi:MAG: hypothetical protein ABFS35_15070 [Bacteroidota bacterium]
MIESTMHIFGLELMEPGNFITDIFMAVATYAFYLKLKNDKSNNHFSYFFLFMALSSFIGGFGHLLYGYLGKPFQVFGWIFSALSIYFIELAALKELRSESLRKRLNVVINLQFVLFLISAIAFQNFMVVTINTIIGLMGLVIPILGIQALQKNRNRNILIISGILLSGIPAFLYRLSLNFGGLNGKELSHLILIICFYIIFLGVNKETEKEKLVNRL